MIDIDLKHLQKECRQLSCHRFLAADEKIRRKVLLEQFPLQRRTLRLRGSAPKKIAVPTIVAPRRLSALKVYRLELCCHIANAGRRPHVIAQYEFMTVCIFHEG
jgi:hypothetical protein